MKNRGAVLLVMMGATACSHQSAAPTVGESVPGFSAPQETVIAESKVDSSRSAVGPGPLDEPKAHAATCLQNGQSAELISDTETVWTSKGCLVRMGPGGGVVSGDGWKLQIPKGIFREPVLISVFRQPFQASKRRKPSEGVRPERSILIIETQMEARLSKGRTVKISLAVSKDLAAMIQQEIGDPVAYYWRSEPAQEINEWWDVKSIFQKGKKEISAEVPVAAFFKFKKLQRMEFLVGVEK